MLKMPVKVDEQTLDNRLRSTVKTPKQFKDALKEQIEKDIAGGKPTELLEICRQSGLTPSEGAALFQLVYDTIPEKVNDKPKGKPNLSTKSLEQLKLQEQEVEYTPSGLYRLNLDPKYTFRFIMVSDTHIGSVHDNIEGLEKMFDHAVAVGAKTVLHAGDVTDGMFRRHPDMFLYLRKDCLTVDGQRRRVVELWPRRKGVTTYFIAGNHDHFAWDLVGYDICDHIDAFRDDMVYLKSSTLAEISGRKGLDEKVLKEMKEAKEVGSGRIGALRIGPDHLPPDKRYTIAMLFHPSKGSSQARSYKPQRIIADLDLLIRSFENMENPQGKRIKPHLLGIGHYHKVDYNLLRNVHVFQAGAGKLPDQFHEVGGLENTTGYRVIELTTKKNGDIERVMQRFEPIYISPTRYTRTVVQMKK